MGRHNVANALAALAAASHAGVAPQEAAAALGSFASVKRRMELIVDRPDIKIYDDFAHHPHRHPHHLGGHSRRGR